MTRKKKETAAGPRPTDWNDLLVLAEVEDWRQACQGVVLENVED